MLFLLTDAGVTPLSVFSFTALSLSAAKWKEQLQEAMVLDLVEVFEKVHQRKGLKDLGMETETML